MNQPSIAEQFVMDPLTVATPGGEHPRDFHDRIEFVLQQTLLTRPETIFGVVAHKAVNLKILRLLTKNRKFFTVGLGSIYKIELNGGEPEISLLNGSAGS